MLTVEMLSQSPALQGLTDAQKQAIAMMSQNDENAVIGTRIGELHGQYDQDVLGITGIAKNAGEKSYDYVKRVLSGYKTKVDSHKAVKAELEATKAQVTDLQVKLEKNVGDETLKQQLKDAKAQVTQLQSTLQTKETEFMTKKAELEAEARNIHVDYAFQAAISSLKFKDGITESVQRVLLQSAKNEVLAKGTPDFIDDSNGGKKLVLRDVNGIIINNPKNNLNPYTMQELVMETSLKDVVDVGRQQSGGGTISPISGPCNASGTLDISGIKTQLEADKAISAHLLANGLTRDSREFAEQSMQLRNENNVAQLPIR